MNEDMSEWIKLISDLKEISREKRLACKNSFKSLNEEDLNDLMISVEADRDQCIASVEQLSDSITSSTKFDTIYKAFIWTVDQLLTAIKERDLDNLTDSFLIFEQIQQKILDVLKDIETESKDY